MSSGLDSRLKDSVRAETLSILRESRATAIVVTHDAEEAMRLGDRIALLRGGRLEQVGTAQEIYNRPASLFAAGFFAEMNVFEAEVAGGRVDTPIGSFAAPGLAEGAAASVAVRLTAIAPAENDGGVEARVITRRFLGDAELVEAAVAGADSPVRARIKCGALPLSGRDIRLAVAESDVLVFERSGESA